MLGYLRYLLYGILLAVGLVLWNDWQKEHPNTNISAIHPSSSTSTPTPAVQTRLLPQALVSSTLAPTSVVPSSKSPHLQIKTDVLNLEIDTHGGKIVYADLPQYTQSKDQPTPTVLLNDRPENFYVANDGFLNAGSDENAAANSDELTYTSEQTHYALSSDAQSPLVVTLRAKTKNGLLVTKQFTFSPHQYAIKTEVSVENQSSQPWVGCHHMQISHIGQTQHRSMFGGLTSFVGAAISTPDKPYQKFSFADLQKQPLNGLVQGGWLALMQHYFLTAWIPLSNASYHYYSHLTADGVYVLGLVGENVVVPAHQKTHFNSQFYVGPKLAEPLEKLAPHLSMTVDYSSNAFFSILSNLLFSILKHIEQIVGNWGWSIVIITLLIKLIFYPLSAASYRSMAAMKKLQPKIQQLKERFGTDKQKFSQALIELYRKEKVSPFGAGCLPVLIQIPVFLALYWVLIESVELRQAPFMFWIQDLSMKDPYFVLPILMGLSMFIQQKLNPQPADPAQAKAFMILPIVLTVLFINFPSGLVLYWVVNNVLSIAQQWFIIQKHEHGRFGRRKHE